MGKRYRQFIKKLKNESLCTVTPEDIYMQTDFFDRVYTNSCHQTNSKRRVLGNFLGCEVEVYPYKQRDKWG